MSAQPEQRHESLALQRERLSLSAAGRRIRVDPRLAAQPHLRSAKGAALYDRYIEEWLVAEDEGMEIMLNEHHQTATCVDPAAPLVLAALARLTTQGAAPDPRQPGRQPPPAGAHRRGNGDGRHPLEGPARMRLRARRALRGAARELESGAHERAPVGGDGPHRQGLDQPRRAGQPRGPLLPPPQHQHLAAPLAAAASADLGVHHHAGRRRRASVRAATCRRRS